LSLVRAPSEDARDADVNLSSRESGFVVSQVQDVFANALSVGLYDPAEADLEHF